MDLASDHDRTERLDHKHSDPPIGYTNSDDEGGGISRDHVSESTHQPQDGHQTDGALLSQIQSRIQTLLPLLTSTSRTERSTSTDPDPLVYFPSGRDNNNARFARAPSNAGHIRHRGGAPLMSAHDIPRGAPQRRDSVVTASESSILSATSPSVGFDQRQQSVQSDTQHSDMRTEMPYRRPGKHRVGESPTPEEYMALPPEAKKKVDNRLSARRSRAKRKEHVHVLTTQITEQQQVIEMLRIENKQLNDHIANLSRAGYSLHPPPFQPNLVPPHPPHLRHPPPLPPSHIHPRQLPPVAHPSLPLPIPSGSPGRSLPAASPSLSTHPSLASSSGLVAAAAAPPTGPGQVPILTHHTHPEAGSSYMGQGQGSMRYESPGRGTKREVEDERDDRLRSRMRYASPERSNWERDPEGRRLSHSAYRSPPERHSHKTRDASRSPSPSPLRPQWGDLPPSLAAPQHLSNRRRLDYDPAEEVGNEQVPIEISGQGTVSDRLATLIRVHKRAIITYRATRRGELSRREEHMEGLLGAAEAIGKEVEELTEEFRYVGQDGD